MILMSEIAVYTILPDCAWWLIGILLFATSMADISLYCSDVIWAGYVGGKCDETVAGVDDQYNSGLTK